jgi:hypothetical protein
MFEVLSPSGVVAAEDHRTDGEAEETREMPAAKENLGRCPC